MTYITDDAGTRWVDVAAKKKRTSPRAVRFADLKVGDQLMLAQIDFNHRRYVNYFLVTDRWFDPVAGQMNEVAGQMVALVNLTYGVKRKSSHTLRGLASKGYQYADIDYQAQQAAFLHSKLNGEVVGIREGLKIRARPKFPGSKL